MLHDCFLWDIVFHIINFCVSKRKNVSMFILFFKVKSLPHFYHVHGGLNF